MSFFSGIRDAAVQMKLAGMIRERTSAIKNMTDLEIDAKKKTFSLKLELAGENETLSVTGSYQLTQKDDKTLIEPMDVKTSREWLTILASELLKGRTFEVPGIVRSIL